MNIYKSSLALTAEEVKDLTSLNQEWKVLTQDLGMAWDKVLSAMSPKLSGFFSDLRDIISMFNEMADSADFAADGIIKSIDKIANHLEERLKNNNIVKFLHGLGGGWIEQGTKWLLKKAQPYIDEIKEIDREYKRDIALQNQKPKNNFIENNKDVVKNNPELVNANSAINSTINNMSPIPQSINNNNQRNVTVGDTYYNITTSGTNLTEQDVAELTRQGNENLINSIINNR